MGKNKGTEKNVIEEEPPFLASWKRVYFIVFLNLVVLIILFYLFTNYFS